MIKLEIIANQAIEEDVIEVFNTSGFRENFTWIAPVFGRGKHGRREASPVWPEENIFFYLVIEEKALDAVLAQLRKVKEHFPDEGLRCYISRDIERLV
ncbi:MAG: hypothetical protein JW874_00365 [Spirochaetales bacterium]|nr:hypothetical protein [Spirochaetales bacterium]